MSMQGSPLTGLLYPYATRLRQMSPSQANPKYLPKEPAFWPKTPLPEELSPAGISPYVMQSYMSNDESKRLLERFNAFMDGNEEIALYAPNSPLQKRALELRQLLGAKNPFLPGLIPRESRLLYDQLLNELHRPGNPYSDYVAEIFPRGAVHVPEGLCPQPFCAQPSCPENSAKWKSLLGHLKNYQRHEAPRSAYIGKLDGTQVRGYFPYGEIVRIEKELVHPISDSTRPAHAAYEKPPITDVLEEHGFTMEVLISLLSVHARRVFGVFRHPSRTGERQSWHPDLMLPSAFYVEDGNFRALISLRVSLPTKLSSQYLSITPLDPRPEDGDHQRDSARTRGRMRGASLTPAEPQDEEEESE